MLQIQSRVVFGLVVGRCNEILVLCDLFELLLTSIDSFSTLLRQDVERRTDTISDDDTLNSATRA